MPNLNELSQLAPKNDALRRAAQLSPLDPVRGAFAGPDDPRMSAEENESARRNAILSAGFSGLLAAGGGANPLQVLGQAGLAGLNARLAINNSYEPPAAKEMKTQVIEVMGDDNLLHRILIDKQTGATIVDLGVSELPEEDGPEFGQPIKVVTGHGDVVLAVFDKKNGTLKSVSTGQILVNATPYIAPTRGVAMQITDQGTGNKYTIMVDPTTNQQIGTARFRGPPDVEGAADDAITISTMKRRFEEVEEHYAARGFKSFGLVDVYSEKNDVTRKFITSEDFKDVKPAQDFIVSAVLKAIQGSRPSDFDMKMYLKFLVPVIGDTPRNVQSKLDRIDQMIQDYQANPAGAFDKTLSRAKGDSSGSGGFYDEFDLDGDGRE